MRVSSRNGGLPTKTAASEESQINWFDSAMEHKDPLTTRIFFRIAGILGSLAVGMAAYGNHVLKPVGEMEKVYNTANLFHHLHSLLLLASVFSRYPRVTGSLVLAGMLIFCGTCYLHVFTGNWAWIQGTPFGGTILMISWLSFAL